MCHFSLIRAQENVPLSPIRVATATIIGSIVRNSVRDSAEVSGDKVFEIV